MFLYDILMVLAKDIYMTQPAGYVRDGTEETVCKLEKRPHCLNESPRCWNLEIVRFQKIAEYKQSNAESCISNKVVFSFGKKVSFGILSLWACNKMLRNADYAQTRKRDSLRQSKIYLESVLKRFGMIDL